MNARRRSIGRARPGRFATLAVCAGLALSGLFSPACDSENACSGSCPTGRRFTDDGTCACEPFDAGYCAVLKDCPDAYCPASSTPGACGAGQAWSTTICGCYPVPGSE